MELHGQSRWMLEHCIRQRVLASTPVVELRTGSTVRGLNYDAAAQPDHRREDARRGTARRTSMPISSSTRPVAAKAACAGCRRSVCRCRKSKKCSVDFGYSSAIVELPDDPARDWKALAMGNLPRVGARGAVLLPIEGGRFICSLGGRAGDYPPDNEADFLEFAKSLPHPTMYETLRGAKFVSGVARMIYPANRFRHYERSETLPRGFIPLGDALCSFNPTYGQGMTSAALQAEALFDTLVAAHAGRFARCVDADVPHARRGGRTDAVATGELQRLPVSDDAGQPRHVHARGDAVPDADSDRRIARRWSCANSRTKWATCWCRSSG